MDLLTWIAAAAALFTLMAVAHHAFWTRRLRQPIRDDGIVTARTADGWRLALGVRRPSGEARHPPVLLVHGLSANRWMLDAGVEGYSLAGHLASLGFHAFSLDLRGHGDSRRPPRGAAPWSFDAYVREDVPAALDAIRDATGQDRVLWVGHSLGALLGLATCQASPERVAGIVALAGPTGFDVDGPVARALRWGFLVDGRFNRTAARMVAPFAGRLGISAAEIAVNVGNVDRKVFRRLMANGIEDVPPGVFRQVAEWVRSDAFRSEDGATDYRAGLARCRQPALFVSAARDGLAPPRVVRRGFEAWGGPKELVELRLGAGHAADYGHTDLLLGRHAPREVFPLVASWLLSHSRPAGGEAR
jgi:pimeloyl-ACP methyl ester carboxylesterase